MSRKIELDLRVNGLDTVEKQVSQLQKSLSIMKQELQEVDSGSSQYQQLTESIKETEEAIKQMTGATEQTTEANVSLRAQLRAVREELQELEPGSQRFQELSERAGQLTNQIGDTQAVINALSGSPMQNLGTALGTATKIGLTGFQGVQGVMQLVGGESEDLMKAMSKLQATMALTQVLKDFGGLGNTFVTLRASFTAFSKSAMVGLSGIQKAIIATGIGALVVAVGLLVAYWDDIKGLVSGVSNEQKELNKLSEQNVKTKEEELKSLKNNENALRLQGKSERDILNIRIATTKELIEAQKIRISNLEQTAEMEIKAAERNAKITKDIIKGALELSSIVLRALAAPIDAVIATANEVSEFLGFGKLTTFSINEEISKMIDGAAEWGASLIFDADAIRKKNDEVIKAEKDKLAELTNSYNGYLLEIQRLDKEAADKGRTEAEKRRSAQLSALLKQFNDEEVLRDALQSERIDKLEGYEKEVAVIQEKWFQAQRALDAEATKAEIEALNERFIKGKLSEKEYREERERIMDFAVMKYGEKERELSRINNETLAKQELELGEKWRKNAQLLLDDILLTANEKQLAAINKNYDERTKQLEAFLKSGLIREDQYTQALKKLLEDREAAIAAIEKKEKKNPYVDLLKDISNVFKNMAGEASGWITNLSSTLVGGVGAVLELTLQEFKTNGEKIAAYAAVIGSVIQGVFSAIGQAQKDNVNQNLQNVQESFNQEASALEDLRKKGGVTEEQYARKRYEIELAAFNKAEELKKAAFEADKGLRISQTIASGAQGAVAAFASAMTIPPPAGQIIGGILAGIMGAMTLANVGIIASQKYGGGAPPQIAQPQLGGGAGGTNISQLGGSQLFGTAGLFGNLGGSPQQGGQMQVRAYVVETDITSTQNTITTLQERSEFG